MDALPTELFSRIFINVLPPDLDDARYQVDDPAPVQVAISCVCQRWNQIAESTPALWTFITLSNKTSSQHTMKRRLALSGNLPLNVSMRLTRVSGMDSDTEERMWGDYESLNEMHTLLVEQVIRWKTLRVKVSANRFFRLRRWIPFELPNVWGLSLTFSLNVNIVHNEGDLYTAFISAPRLTFCSSDGYVGNSERAVLTG